jgi:Fe-S cluster assembly protein SufD
MTTTTEPEWLAARRRDAQALVGELALPTQKDKGWEFTDLSGLDLDAYSPSAATVATEIPDLPAGVTVLPLADALGSQEDLLREKLGSVVPNSDPFVARNETAWNDGLLVHVAAGVALEQPIKVELTLDEAGASVNWRTLIVLEDGAEAEVWEEWKSEADEIDALLNAVTEISVGDSATLRYISLQDISEGAWIFATQRGEVGRDGTLEWTALGLGSGRGKVRMETKLAGKGSEAKVTGGYAGGGSQHLDYDTLQEHAAENTVSDLAFRGVLGDKATSVWRGMIKVDPGAQQTDAFQENRNLLLTRDAHADAIPGLEILADDVRCTHAAAIAQIDESQLFYLSSRGLDNATARRLVIDAFMQELVERVEDGPLREELSGALERRLVEILG